MLKLFKQYKYLVFCTAVYVTWYWRSWNRRHFLAHPV